MKIWPDCIPCILKMSLGSARLVLKDEDKIKRFMEQVLKLNYFRGEDWGVTSPEVIKSIWTKLIEHSGEVDPMKWIKEEQNRKALNLYPIAKESVLKSQDPLLEAIKLAIAGNAIDAMKDVNGEVSEEILKKFQKLKMIRKDLNHLKNRLGKSHKLIYLGDNCGEIVFDKLLIEVLRKMYDLEILFVTRTLPIMNDATLQDAISVGIETLAQTMENGLNEPFPGTLLNKVNPELLEKIETSDLIISKGGGNYDTLTEEQRLKGKVTFLFLAKCEPYCCIHNVSLNTPILFNF